MAAPRTTPTRTPMSVQDALWLTMDRPNALMVVDGAMTLGAAPDLAAVHEVFARAVERFPVFSRRAVRTRGSWVWEDDPDFELGRHVTSVRLRGKADMVALQAFLAAKRAEPLPRDRPLWAGYLVENLVLEDGRKGAAIVTRFHHAIADGVRLTQVMLSLCDGDHSSVAAVVAREGTGSGGLAGAVEVARGVAVDVVAATTGVAAKAVSAGSSLVSAGPGAVGSAATDALGAVSQAVRDPLGAPAATGRAVSKVLRRSASGVDDAFGLARRPDRWLDALEFLGVEEHRATIDLTTVAKLAVAESEDTIWTGKPGTVKAIAWSAPIPLDDVKRIGRRYVCTVNDVLLAAVAGGLRQYLTDRDAAVDEVVWMVPVNLKPHSHNLPSELGNYFALVFLPMPLDDAEPEARLRRMHQQMARIKASDEAAMTFGLQRLVSMSPSQVAFQLTNFFANKSIGVLTNVPGPRSAMTFAGAPVEQVVGFAPCSGDQPMTATIFSYDGAVTVGFATDAGLVPDPEVLAALVTDEVATMLATVQAR